MQRSILFDLRDEIVPPTNETVAQVFARISAYRDSMDGPQFDDQGLLNTDPRMIAVPEWVPCLSDTQRKHCTEGCLGPPRLEG